MKVCAHCFQRQVRVWYDWVGMPIGLCCIRRALEDADEVLSDMSVLDLMRRLGWRA